VTTTRGTQTIGRACTGKRRYTNQHNAEHALTHLIDHAGANPDTVTAYACPHGDHWHLGHRPGSRRKR
jgi:hypothetical protein